MASDSLQPHRILHAKILEWVAFPFSKMIFPVVMYRYENWTIKKADH